MRLARRLRASNACRATSVPIDQEYCYSQIPDDDAAFGRRQLHRRAAQFFRRQRLPQVQWSTLDDISAPLAEFEHLIQADGYQPSLGFALWSLGGNLSYVGQFEQAIACHNTAIGVYQEMNALRGVALHLVGRAFVNGRLGRYEPAFDDLREAGGIYDALLDREGIHTVQMGRGGALAQKGASGDAILVLQAVRASGIHNRITLAFATHFLVHALLAAGRLAEARALVANTPTGPLSLPAISTLVMDGILRARLDEREQARATFRKVLADAEPFLHRPGRFQFRYLCGLARAGLAVTDGAEAWLDGAVADITAALNECAAPGLVSQHKQLLEALMACPGGERLNPIWQIMAAAR